MKPIISNAYRTCSLSNPSVIREVNELMGHGSDPADLLMKLEEQGDALWRAEHSHEPRSRFIRRYIASAIANL